MSCRHDIDMASEELTRLDVANMSAPTHRHVARHVGVSVVLGGKSPTRRQHFQPRLQLPHPHLCCQSAVHCCHRKSIHPGRRMSSRAIFVVFAPRWAAALLVTFLLHQTQSTTHRHHHCTPPPLCQSQQMRWHCLLTPHSAVTVTVAAIVTLAVDVAKPSPSHCPAAAAAVSVA